MEIKEINKILVRFIGGEKFQWVKPCEMYIHGQMGFEYNGEPQYLNPFTSDMGVCFHWLMVPVVVRDRWFTFVPDPIGLEPEMWKVTIHNSAGIDYVAQNKTAALAFCEAYLNVIKELK